MFFEYDLSRLFFRAYIPSENVVITCDDFIHCTCSHFDFYQHCFHIKLFLIHVFYFDEKEYEEWERESMNRLDWASWYQKILAFAFLHNISGMLMMNYIPIHATRNDVVVVPRFSQTECPICLRLFEPPEEPLAYCKNCCGTIFHFSCVDKWLTSSSSSTCPICRISWNYLKITRNDFQFYTNKNEKKKLRVSYNQQIPMEE